MSFPITLNSFSEIYPEMNCDIPFRPRVNLQSCNSSKAVELRLDGSS